MLEMIVRIDNARWDEGLGHARQLGEYDSWFLSWRIPIDGTMRGAAADGETWARAAALCLANGWIIRTVVDPANRPVAWASPQFRAADKAAWLPVTAE